MKIRWTCTVVLLLCLFSGCSKKLQTCNDAGSREECINEESFESSLSCEWVEFVGPPRTHKCVPLEK